MQNIQDIKTKDVVKYILLPGVVPRMKGFAQSGFGWLAHLMAIIYYSARLLPAGHAYLNASNIGKFGIRHVIAEASRHLVMKKENIDQMIIFAALLMGFILLVMQFAYILLMFVVAPAFAAGTFTFTSFFVTPNPTNDIAYMLLDAVFGIPDLYNSCVANVAKACSDKYPVGAGFPSPFHIGLHAMFQFYSLLILIVAVLVVLYYVLVTLGETAMTGTPFGKRFNTIWAPIRLVVAVGLLVPVNYGLNSAQYITLFAAKWGSSFATNGWLLFNETLTNGVGQADAKLIARPDSVDVSYLIEFISVARACKVAYEWTYWRGSAAASNFIRPYLVKAELGDPYGNQEVTAPTAPSWEDALAFYNNGDIIIRFGELDIGDYSRSKGGVKPFCGEITVHTDDVTQIGSREMQKKYYELVVEMWFNLDIEEFGRILNCIYLPVSELKLIPANCDNFTIVDNSPSGPGTTPNTEWKLETVAWANLIAADFVSVAHAVAVAGTDFALPQELKDRGWAGAGIWYNRIAQWNGALMGSAKNVPSPSLMPEPMQKVQEEKRQHDESTDALNRFQPYLSDGTDIDFEIDGERMIANVLNGAYLYWQESDSTGSVDTKSGGNVFFDTLNVIFGLNGLFNMRKNKDIHPLAQLSAIGKGILESAVRNLMLALAFSVGGGMTEVLEQHVGSAFIGVASSVFVSLGTVGLTVGFVLYYVLPFLPFMYFFFAVGGWVKGIFEAMVGVPLWALAHLRVDGNGLPGDTAMNGYFLIFEIFIRPILTVFGLLGGLIIFSAMVRVLNDTFDLVVENLTGFDCMGDCAKAGKGSVTALGMDFKRAILDEFFFTIIYTIIVYMMATSSFKMIDQVPNTILRWMGSGAQTFGDQSGDATEGLVQYAAMGGNIVGGQVVGAAMQGAKVTGQGLGAAAKPMKNIIDGMAERMRMGGVGGGPNPAPSSLTVDRVKGLPGP